MGLTSSNWANNQALSLVIQDEEPLIESVGQAHPRVAWPYADTETDKDVSAPNSSLGEDKTAHEEDERRRTDPDVRPVKIVTLVSISISAPVYFYLLPIPVYLHRLQFPHREVIEPARLRDSLMVIRGFTSPTPLRLPKSFPDLPHHQRRANVDFASDADEAAVQSGDSDHGSEVARNGYSAFVSYFPHSFGCSATHRISFPIRPDLELTSILPNIRCVCRSRQNDRGRTILCDWCGLQRCAACYWLDEGSEGDGSRMYETGFNGRRTREENLDAMGQVGATEKGCMDQGTILGEGDMERTTIGNIAEAGKGTEQTVGFSKKGVVQREDG
ncbi:hypothetical protein FRC12_005331 [Ceratobasidium sp. 428]|nr:hypothetical protein FRC12_005331 [Ceratobasidium sp. 428]